MNFIMGLFMMLLLCAVICYQTGILVHGFVLQCSALPNSDAHGSAAAFLLGLLTYAALNVAFGASIMLLLVNIRKILPSVVISQLSRKASSETSAASATSGVTFDKRHIDSVTNDAGGPPAAGRRDK